MKILKNTGTKKVIMYLYNLGEENFLEVAAFVIFPTSIMVLFEIHQRFKGHFLNELRVSISVPYCQKISREENFANWSFIREIKFPRKKKLSFVREIKF